MRGMTGGDDPPAALFDNTVAFASGRKGAWQGHAEPIGVDEGAVAGRGRALGQPLLVKNGHRARKFMLGNHRHEKLSSLPRNLMSLRHSCCKPIFPHVT